MEIWSNNYLELKLSESERIMQCSHAQQRPVCCIFFLCDLSTHTFGIFNLHLESGYSAKKKCYMHCLAKRLYRSIH